jgi:hypothetical protein
MTLFFAGILVGVFATKWIVPFLDVLFEVYCAKKTCFSTKFSIDAQKQVMDYRREYPESQQVGSEAVSAIGYRMDSSEYIECDDFEDKKIGF